MLDSNHSFKLHVKKMVRNIKGNIYSIYIYTLDNVLCWCG